MCCVWSQLIRVRSDQCLLSVLLSLQHHVLCLHNVGLKKLFLQDLMDDGFMSDDEIVRHIFKNILEIIFSYTSFVLSIFELGLLRIILKGLQCHGTLM